MNAPSSSSDSTPGPAEAELPSLAGDEGWEPSKSRTASDGIPEARSPANCLDDVRDAIDDLNDAAEMVFEVFRNGGTAEWVVATIEEYTARVRSGVRPRIEGVTAQASVRLATRSLRRLAGVPHSSRGSLLRDLDDALPLFGERDGRLASSLLGVRGPHVLTLEEVGAQEGVTRERIRQLFVRFKAKATGRIPPLISLALLQVAIDRSGPLITDLGLLRVLPAPIILSVEDLRILKPLAKLGWLRRVVETRYRGVWLKAPEAQDRLEATVKSLRPKVGRSIRRWGAVELDTQPGVNGWTQSALMYTLAAHGRELQLVDGWAILKQPDSTVLMDRLGRIARVTKTLTLPRLRRALKRAIRTVPPDGVLRELLVRQAPDVIIDGKDVVHFPPDLPGRLSQSELLAERLIREHDGVITLRNLERGFVQEGMSAGSAGVAYSRSVILERFGPGALGLIGSTPDAKRLFEARRSLKEDSARSLLGYRRLGSDVELLYKVDRDLLSSTMFLVPRGVLAVGEWQIGDSAGRIIVRKGYLVGLQKAAKALFEADVLRLSVLFKPETRTVYIARR